MRLFQDLVIVLLSRKACSEVPQYLDININTEDQIETHVRDKNGCLLFDSIPASLPIQWYFQLLFQNVNHLKTVT